MATKNLAQATSVVPIPSPVQAVGATAATIYTVPTGSDTTSKVDALVLSNTTSGALTAKVTVTPSGGSAAQVGPLSILIPAGDAVTVDEIKGMYPQGTVFIVTPSATGLTAKMTGLEFS